MSSHRDDVTCICEACERGQGAVWTRIDPRPSKRALTVIVTVFAAWAAFVLAFITAVLLAGCNVRMHEPEELERAVYEETVAAWKAFGMPELDRDCHLDRLVIVEHVDPTDFWYDCQHRPDVANACRGEDWDGRDINNETYPEAIISPLARNGAVPALAVHELLHAALFCSEGTYDIKHARDDIWYGVESEAKAAFY